MQKKASLMKTFLTLQKWNMCPQQTCKIPNVASKG